MNLTYIDWYQRIFDFGTGTNNYLYVLNCGNNPGFENYATAINLSTGSKTEEGVHSESNLPDNAWCLVTVTMDKNGIIKLYKDKTLIDSKQTESRVKDLATAIISQQSEDDSHCYVAASNYTSDACTAAKFCDFRLYNRALSGDEVKALYYPTEQDLAQGDADAITLSQTQDIVEDFYLPATGVYGSDIS